MKLEVRAAAVTKVVLFTAASKGKRILSKALPTQREA